MMNENDSHDFQGVLTKCGFTTTSLQVQQVRQRNHREAPSGDIFDEFLEFVDENEQSVCTVSSREFSSVAKNTLHVCKGARLENDLVSVALLYAHQLISEGKIDFIDTRERGSVSNAESKGE